MKTYTKCPHCGTQLEVYEISFYPPMYGTNCPNDCKSKLATVLNVMSKEGNKDKKWWVHWLNDSVIGVMYENGKFFLWDDNSNGDNILIDNLSLGTVFLLFNDIGLFENKGEEE